MRVSTGQVRAYRKAANKYKRGLQKSSEQIDNCALLVERMGKQSIREYEGLYLPSGKKQPESLMGMLATKQLIRVVLPVCPPLPLSPRTFSPELSPEAKAGIRAAKVLSEVFARDLGIEVQPKLLIADTETDLESVMGRAGGPERYLEVCNESAVLAEEQLTGVASATTFSEYFGKETAEQGGFHVAQYTAEAHIRNNMDNEDEVRRKITRVSLERADKHKLILGRKEEGCELAIRYAAQYMALGDYIRDSNAFDMVCNYPTPNNEYYNSPEKTVLPLFESRVQRRV